MSGTVLPLSCGSFSIASRGLRAQRLGVLAEALQHRHDDARRPARAGRAAGAAGATSGLECSEASRCAAATASWDLIVKRSCCMLGMVPA